MFGFRIVSFHNARGNSFVWSVCHDKQKPVLHAATESVSVQTGVGGSNKPLALDTHGTRKSSGGE